jgi:hypothetical protein
MADHYGEAWIEDGRAAMAEAKAEGAFRERCPRPQAI